MKKSIIYLIAFCAVINILITGVQQSHAQKPGNIDMDSLSYNLGVILATNLQSQGFNEVNVDRLQQGILEVYEGKEVDVESANKAVQKYMQKLASKAQTMAQNAEVKFLTENAKKEGVITTSSGLQYEVLKEGTGNKPSASDKVTVHYTGKLLNGQVFDSSVERGEPASFPVNGVIQGWQEALQLMPVGSKYKLYIPYELAYGERGAGQSIPPYSTLIFEVELLQINK